MGAASSLANAAVEQLSGEELVAARAQVQDHVGRLEADNAALKARRAAGVAELVSGAARTKERFDAHFRALGDVAGVACDPPAALKKVARIVEKVVALGSPARVFDERFVARPAAGGWRDALVNARFADDDVVFEVQIVHRELLVARRGLPGHAIYNKVRTARETLEKMGLSRDDRPRRVRELRTGAGATAARLRALGVSLDDLVAARCFDASELRAGGASAQELRDRGVPLADILRAGYAPEELRVADAADPGALLDAGYAWDDVAEAFDLKRPDKLALLHLMHALKTVAFLKEKRWGSQRPLGEWYGVETDDRGRVDGLGLSNFNFPEGATLPASIGKLDGLASLALSGGESLAGPLPRELADLDKLEHLNVSGTNLVLPTPPGCPPRPTPKGDLGLRWCGTMVMSAAGHAKKLGVRAGFHAVAVDGAALADADAKAAVARAPEWRLLDPKTGYALEMAKRDGRASVRLRVAGPSKTLARRSYDIEFDLERMIQRNHTATYASSKGPPERRIARFGLGEAPKNLRGLI
ncbi:hypothetical protein JL720_525 [Aureococcus anophagefferens]|nr:hypothetical protein JL720_525 [Aureococcus anophagefferens]